MKLDYNIFVHKQTCEGYKMDGCFFIGCCSKKSKYKISPILVLKIFKNFIKYLWYLFSAKSTNISDDISFYLILTPQERWKNKDNNPLFKKNY